MTACSGSGVCTAVALHAHASSDRYLLGGRPHGNVQAHESQQHEDVQESQLRGRCSADECAASNSWALYRHKASTVACTLPGLRLGHLHVCIDSGMSAPVLRRRHHEVGLVAVLRVLDMRAETAGRQVHALTWPMRSLTASPHVSPIHLSTNIAPPSCGRNVGSRSSSKSSLLSGIVLASNEHQLLTLEQ